MASIPSAILIRIGRAAPPTTLRGDQVPITIGRSEDSTVVLDDRAASRTHAILDRSGSSWILTDVSRHGTQLRTTDDSLVMLRGSARRLQHEDIVVFGSTAFRFKEAEGVSAAGDRDLTPPLSPKVPVTPRQYDVLRALSAPLQLQTGEAPASNQEIAAELFISIEAVRGHLSELYRAFEIEDAAQMQRRIRLASQWWRAEIRR